MEHSNLIKFIPANDLKKHYNVFGHFYSIYLNSKDKIDCRSVLEIVAKNTTHFTIDSLSNQLTEAVFIMMNPGSSKPLEKTNNNISWKNINQLKISLVPTKPDTTQYQVMRLMHYCNWKHVRVLNISDLRDPNWNSFSKRYRQLENQTGFTAHSIFDSERINELNLKLKRKRSAPIICAWGVSDDLNSVIDRCIAQIGNLHLTGLLKDGNKYYHPLPSLQRAKEEWINKMLIKLNGD